MPAAPSVHSRFHSKTFAYFAYPPQHWLKIKTNNPMERLLKEARRRTKVVGAFPDVNSALMLVAARVSSLKIANVRRQSGHNR
jgi:putative transposase